MQRMTLGKKIVGGIGLTVLMLVVVAVSSILGVNRIVGKSRKVITGDQLRAEILQKEVDHLSWANAVLSSLTDESATGLRVQTDFHKCALGKWYYGEGRKEAEASFPQLKGLLAQLEEPHKALHESAVAMDVALKDPTGKDGALSIFLARTAPSLEKVQGLLKRITAEMTKESGANDARMMSTAVKTRWTVVILGVLACLFGVGLAFVLRRSTVGILANIMESLGTGADHVSSSSSQLTQASQSLAEGSSEQAASLEETSSAMEEMSAMTKQNAAYAGEAKVLANGAGTSVEKANASMGQMVGQMGQISSMGEEIGKIIKTIDEIAFQTNLLALNAAVEAARAGEAGAGFAVVADEVRNLAQRAAGAARSTADLIEGTIKKIQDGTTLVENTNTDFQDVVSAVKKVAELVGEIASASEEQSRGISEVSTAVTQMDKVTQQNAANAEEIASASEEMNAQAVSLMEAVRTLDAMVTGQSGANSAAGSAGGREAAVPRPVRKVAAFARSASQTVRATAGGNGKARAGGNGGAAAWAGKPNPEQASPPEEHSISEF